MNGGGIEWAALVMASGALGLAGVGLSKLRALRREFNSLREELLRS